MATLTATSSFNNQFHSGQMDISNGPRKNKAIPHCNDKYHVIVKDGKGKEYRIEYL